MAFFNMVIFADVTFGAATANMCLSYTTAGLSKLIFLGKGEKNNEQKMVGENGTLVSCVSHCDRSMTFILLRLHFPSTC